MPCAGSTGRSRRAPMPTTPGFAFESITQNKRRQPDCRRAASAAASSAIIGVAIMRNSAFGKLPGFGVSSSS